MQTTPADIEAALSGNAHALRRLVDAMAPTVERYVVRGLFRQRTRARGRDVRQEIDDMTQEVFVALFDDSGRALRAWCPDRGLPFDRFVGLLADRQVAAVLRSGRRSPWKEDALETEALEARPGHDPSQAARVEAKNFGEAVVERLLEELSPRGIQLFELLFVEERPVPEIMRTVRADADVIYAWRSRILKRARAIAADLDENGGGSVRSEGLTHKDLLT